MKSTWQQGLFVFVVLAIISVSLIFIFENKIVTREGFIDFLAGACFFICVVWLVISLIKFKENIKNAKNFYDNVMTPLFFMSGSIVYFLWLDSLI